MSVEIYRDDLGEWRWRKRAANGKVIADSGEGYRNFDDCHRMASAEAGDEEVIELPDTPRDPA